MDKRNFIAKNVATLLSYGNIVNLGIGIPSLVSSFIPKEKDILIHSENGVIGVGKAGGFPWSFESRESVIKWLESYGGELGSWKTMHRDLCNASNEVVNLVPGAICFDSCMSFAIARGGHLDATVLGALQVDEKCNLANWKIPGKKLNGMGGAMDIVCGSKRVIIAMEHCTKNGNPKIMKEITLPLTASGCVTDIVTELCIIKCEPYHFIVTAIAPGVSEMEIRRKTFAEVTFADNLREMIC